MNKLPYLFGLPLIFVVIAVVMSSLDMKTLVKLEDGMNFIMENMFLNLG